MIFRHKVVENSVLKGKTVTISPPEARKIGVLGISVKRVYPPGVGGCLRNLTEWDLGTRKFYGMKPYG